MNRSPKTTFSSPSSTDRLSADRSRDSIPPFRGGYPFGLALVGAFLSGALQVFGQFSFPVDFAITAVAALPSMTFGLCLLASRKARAVAVFKPGSLLSLIAGGRILPTAIIAVLARSGAYFMLHELRGCQPWEWAVLASVALLLPAVFGALDHLLFRGVRLYVRRSLALLTACGVAAGLAVGVYFFLGQSLAAGRAPVGLADEIAAARQAVSSLSGNVLAREVAQTMAFFSGLKAHLCASPAGESLRLFLIVAAGKWASFFAVATMIGLFLLPGREWMRGSHL